MTRLLVGHLGDVVAGLGFGVATVVLFDLGSDRGERAAAVVALALVGYAVARLLRRRFGTSRF
jgi:hypothetical protein